MKRLVLKFLNVPIFIILILLGISIQSTCFSFYPLNYLQPDFILIAIIWCALRRSFFEGGVLTLLLGRIGEIHSSSPQGIMMLSYMMTFLMTRVIYRWLMMPSLTSWVVLTLGASIFYKLFALWVLYLLGVAENQWKQTISLLLPGAAVAGIIGVWIYAWLEKFDLATYKDPRSEKKLEEDLQLEGEGF